MHNYKIAWIGRIDWKTSVDFQQCEHWKILQIQFNSSTLMSNGMHIIIINQLILDYEYVIRINY